jgi:hypothetical protein
MNIRGSDEYTGVTDKLKNRIGGLFSSLSHVQSTRFKKFDTATIDSTPRAASTLRRSLPTPRR